MIITMMGITMSEIRIVIKNFNVIDGKIIMKPESDTNYPFNDLSKTRSYTGFIPYYTIYDTYVKSKTKNTTFIE